ncbi:MAG TPA: thioredoxin domain-containing protein [Bryobacteraceae bacterium]|nr:thioredoxin domain-containing protein [Bryobacteraceae bacterium]
MKLYAALLVALLPLAAAMTQIDKERATGNPSAPVKLEVYSDFTCPHCKHFHEEELPQLMRDYVVPGKMYIIDRAFVLPHQYSREAFAYAVAAARIGKYHAVADALYAQQANWFANGNLWGAVASALPSAAEQKKVQELSRDPGVIAEFETESRAGANQGINETPTLVITVGSKTYPLPPAPDYRLLKSMIDGILPK